jgi:hypothetical protein
MDRQPATSGLPRSTDIVGPPRHVRVVPILLQKSKIERCQKSRESGFLDTSTAAIPRSADAKVRGHFCAKQLGPSHRLIRNASAVPGNFDRHPKKTFATISAKTGLTFADLVRRKGVKERSCSPAYLATKRRAATPEVEKLQIRAAMKATPIPRSDLIMLTRLSH